MISAIQNKGVDTSHIQVLDGKTAVTHVDIVDGDRVFGKYEEGVLADFKLREQDISFIKKHDLAVSYTHLPDVGDLMLAVTDTAIAAQNAVVAAESFGIGSCYIGDIMENCEEQRKLLQLPEYVFPAVMIVFGWPTKQQMKRKKPERCEQKHIVHENTYRNMEGDELREMFAYKCKNSTYEEWCSAFCNRKYNSDFSKEMSLSLIHIWQRQCIFRISGRS